MKSWRVVLLVGLVASVAQAAPMRNELDVRDAEGNVYGKLVICNDCKSDSEKGKTCHPGAPEGWLDGKPCGSCLLRSNLGVLVKYPYDLHVGGTLVDKNGKPIDKRFVKMFMPNGWGIRSKTNDKGVFRLMLGATDARKGKQRIMVDIGQRVDSVSAGVDENFSLYLLPVDYKPCSGEQPDKATANPMDHLPDIGPKVDPKLEKPQKSK